MKSKLYAIVMFENLVICVIEFIDIFIIVESVTKLMQNYLNLSSFQMNTIHFAMLMDVNYITILDYKFL